MEAFERSFNFLLTLLSTSASPKHKTLLGLYGDYQYPAITAIEPLAFHFAKLLRVLKLTTPNKFIHLFRFFQMRQ